MNYEELIKSIKARPKFFLRSESIVELEAFLNGVAYMNFSKENDIDELREFQHQFIPSKFEKDIHDWIMVFNNKSPKEAFDYFFELWDEFMKSKNVSS